MSRLGALPEELRIALREQSRRSQAIARQAAAAARQRNDAIWGRKKSNCGAT